MKPSYKERLWLVMKMMKKGGSSIGLEINLETDGMAGLVPVFKRYEDAEKYAEGAKIYCIAAMKREAR